MVDKTENEIAYWRRIYETQAISAIKNTENRVQECIGLELDGILRVADRLPDGREKDWIIRYVDAIKKRMSDFSL